MEAILFIGIQAVGKSTFYKERFFATHVRINLDMLKTRHRELLLLQACIAARQPFVVDNTNIFRRDRARYIDAAKPAGFRIVGYYFQSRLKDALQRNSQREGKANIPEKGVLAKYQRLEIPSYAEGFDQLYYVAIEPAASQFLIREWEDEIR
jgi:predicted kinase